MRGHRRQSAQDFDAESDLGAVKVAIIEDEDAHFLLMKRAIEKELPLASVRHFDTAIDCLDEIDAIDPDIILADYLMPGVNGIEFLSILKRTGREIPVVMITGQGDENIAVQAMKLGARDYLVKSAAFFMLVPSVIKKVVREENLRQIALRGSRLNELLLDSLSFPALLVSPDRIILAANRIAREMGAQTGRLCWRDFRHRKQRQPSKGEGHAEDSAGESPNVESACSFCRLEGMFQEMRTINSPEVDAFGILWDMWWIPLDSGTCLHYAFDVTERKQTELDLRASEEQLRFLSARLLAAQEEERKRISRELHDSIGSSLSSIMIYLEAALSQMPAGTQNPETLQTAISITRDTIGESRRIVSELRPSVLDDFGIVAALGWLCRRFRDLHPDVDIHERFEVEEAEIPEPLKIVILRIVQEAFSNIVKYSEAMSVTVALVREDDLLQLIVNDDGIGFDIASLPSRKDMSGGFGLTSMKERAELSHGIFRMTSGGGNGTTVSASWSLSAGFNSLTG